MASTRPSRVRAGTRRRARPRRSHAERTAQTRERLMGAVVASIAELGLARTTAPEIARRAGVTWGAVQHHFGDKDGMLISVLDDSFRRLAQSLEAIPLDNTSLENRVSLFVDRAWEHFGSAHYRSTQEILVHYLGSEPSRAKREWRDRMGDEWDRLWQRLFADAGLPKRSHLALENYAICLLSGLASTLMLEGGSVALRPAVLELLKQTLVRELSRAGRAAARVGRGDAPA